MTTRGIRRKGFRSLLQGGWSTAKEKFLKGIQKQVGRFMESKFIKIGKRYENVYVDIDKRLVMCDKQTHTPEEWGKINNLSWLELYLINIGIHWLKVGRYKHVIIAPYNPSRNIPGMNDTMISVDGSAFFPLKQQLQMAYNKPTDKSVLKFVEDQSRMVATESAKHIPAPTDPQQIAEMKKMLHE